MANEKENPVLCQFLKIARVTKLVLILSPFPPLIGLLSNVTRVCDGYTASADISFAITRCRPIISEKFKHMLVHKWFYVYLYIFLVKPQQLASLETSSVVHFLTKTKNWKLPVNWFVIIDSIHLVLRNTRVCKYYVNLIKVRMDKFDSCRQPKPCSCVQFLLGG